MLEVVANVVMIHDRHEIRHAHVAIERAHAHGQLVAEIAHGGQAHAGDAQMLAQRGGGLHVVFVERDDAVELVRARQMGDRLHDVGEGNFCGKVEGIVEAFARPVGVAQFFRGQQNHAAALALALAHELLPLFVGRDAEKSQRARLRHGVHVAAGLREYHGERRRVNQLFRFLRCLPKSPAGIESLR